jgi:multidrug efflux pump subunit AcrB
LDIFPHQHINRLELARKIKTTLDQPQKWISLPPEYQLLLNYDDTEYLQRELNKTWVRAGLSIAILLLLILVVSRNLRYLALLFLSIIVSYGITLGFTWLLGIEVHLYTLAAVTIAMGIIIDNSIILLDHLKKYGTLSILPAQLAASLTTMASLAVIFLLPENYRAGLEDFAAMVVLSLSVSFVVSWWFTPALHYLWPVQNHNKSRHHPPRLATIYFQLITWLSRRKRWVMVACVLAFGLPVFLLPTRWEGQEWYNRTLGSDLYLEEIRPTVNKVLGGALRLFYVYAYESSFYRTPEKTRLYVNARLPYGHTLEQMNQVMQEVEQYLATFPEIDKFITYVSSGRYANISIEFHPEYASGTFPYLMKNRLIQRSLAWGGVDWSVFGVGRGFSNSSGDQLPSFMVRMTGYNYDDLALHAEKLARKLLRHKRIQEVDTEGQLSWQQQSFTSYHFEPQTARFRPDYLHLHRHLMAHAPQDQPILYLPYRNQNFPVYLRSDDSDHFDLYRLQYQPWQDIPSLDHFGRLVKKKNTDAIVKEERQYLRAVRFDYYGSYRFGKKYLDQVLEEMKAELPSGYRAEHSRWSWGSEEKKKQNEVILLLMLILFFIASIHLESFRKALFVVFMVPFSFIGLFLAFGWLGFSFDQGGYAAFLMTSGLSVNAVLYLISDIQEWERKIGIDDAVKQAVTAKAWPITLTILSTCLGLVPFLVHGSEEVFWYSFAVGTISGLLFSLVLFFLVVPVWMMKSKTLVANRK